MRKMMSCGTQAGHALHLAHNEPPCEKCQQAYDTGVAAYERRKGWDRAHQRALATLREDNRPLFNAIHKRKLQKEADKGHKASARAYQAAMRELARALRDDFDAVLKVELTKVREEMRRAGEGTKD